MKRLLLLSIACIATTHAQTVDYTTQIAPLWDTYCVDCHSADDADGEFALDTFAALMKGGEEDAAIVAGQADESHRRMFLDGRPGRVQRRGRFVRARSFLS